MYMLQFAYLFKPDGHLGFFHLLAIGSNAAMNIGVQYLLKSLRSFLLCIYPEVELLGHNGNSTFNFLKNCHTIFHSSCIHSHQQSTIVPISLLICISSLEKCIFKFFVYLKIRLFVFLSLICRSSLYILNVNPLPDIYNFKIFSPIP